MSEFEKLLEEILGNKMKEDVPSKLERAKIEMTLFSDHKVSTSVKGTTYDIIVLICVLLRDIEEHSESLITTDDLLLLIKKKLREVKES